MPSLTQLWHWKQRFGHIPIAIFSLFQMITLDNWSDFYNKFPSNDTTLRTVMIGKKLCEDCVKHHQAWFVDWSLIHLFLFIFLLSPHAVYSIIFVILESFIFINLFIAVIVNNLQTQNEKVKKKKRQKARETVAGDVSMKEQEEFKLKSDKRPSQYSKDNMEGVGNSNKASRVGSEDMDLHYQEFNLPTWEKHIMSDFLMALAALDNNMESYQRTQQTLDDLVDLSLEEQKDDDANII